MVYESQVSKIEEVYLYIIKKSQENINFGKTLFYKILYFSDFDFYEQNEMLITDDTYYKLSHGPAPSSFEKVISDLKAKNLILDFTINRKGYIQIRYILVDEFEPSQISPRELSTLDQEIERLSGMTASQVSAYSHSDMPYRATKDNEEIDPELVFYRDPVFSTISEIQDEIEA